MSRFGTNIVLSQNKNHRNPISALVEQVEDVILGRPANGGYSYCIECLVRSFLTDMYMTRQISEYPSDIDVRDVADVLNCLFIGQYGANDSISMRRNPRHTLGGMKIDIIDAMIGDRPLEGCKAIESLFCLERLRRLGKIKDWVFDVVQSTPLRISIYPIPHDEIE